MITFEQTPHFRFHIFSPMPTPESAAAFAKLVAARTNLTEVTKLLNECHEHGSRQRYNQLQAEWDRVYKEFQVATDEFADTVKTLPEIVVTHRLPAIHNSH